MLRSHSYKYIFLAKLCQVSRWLFIAIVSLAISTNVSASIYLTVSEALEIAFPQCDIQRRTIYLTQEQKVEANKLTNVSVKSSLVYPYVAYREGEFVGVAYFDNHIVRTLSETIMVVVDQDNRIERIELLAFNEPPSYIPSEIWYDQFIGQKLDKQLVLNRKIRGILGATLTTRQTTAAARRILAIHNVIKEQLKL
tara:strand:- start:150998 stop:151585 length:588 start_codon:yes stop_codon:yes gene_type:complete